jgi:hypothetical protein
MINFNYFYRGPNGMGQVPLARYFNKGSIEIGIIQNGFIFIFLRILEVHRSGRNNNEISLKKCIGPDLRRTRAAQCRAGPVPMRCARDPAFERRTSGAHWSAAGRAEAVCGIGGRPIKGRSTAPVHLLPLATTDMGQNPSGG